MPAISRSTLLKLIRFLNRFVPVVARGLALGFAVIALATALFGMGDYPTTGARLWVAALFAVFAAVSFGIGLAVKPVLKWIMRFG